MSELDDTVIKMRRRPLDEMTEPFYLLPAYWMVVRDELARHLMEMNELPVCNPDSDHLHFMLCGCEVRVKNVRD